MVKCRTGVDLGMTCVVRVIHICVAPLSDV